MGEIVIPMPRNQWPPGVDGQVHEIFSKLDALENLVLDVERRSKKEDGDDNQWLQSLNKLSDEVEIWWDDFRMISHKPKTLGFDETGKNRRISYMLQRLRSYISFPFFQMKNASVHRALKTKDLNQKLEEILNDAATSSETAPATIGSVKSLHASATFSRIENPLVTLDEDKQAVMKHLIGGNDVRVKVLAIVGEAGMGKTALAKQLYHDAEVKKCFQLRKWVQVSDNFDEEVIAKALLGSPQQAGDSGLWSGSLLEVIKSQFSEKKFLLVMNNVTGIDPKIWDSLLDSLKLGAPGSAILLTAGYEHVVREACLGHTPPHCLDHLRGEKGWLWLKELALSGRSSDFHESVRKIGYEIVHRVGGLAFGITIIGSHLQFKDTVKEWEQVLSSYVWKSEKNFESSQCAMLISYNDLSLQLQRCFLYIARIPVGTDINVERLIYLWMAEGYLGPPRNAGLRNGNRNAMERKGRLYFNELVMRSFFHKLVKSSFHEDKIICFQMRDIIHRYANELISESSTLNLRSFCIVPQPQKHDILQGLLKQWKYMRALDLSSCQLRELPKEVGSLILLQHLNLSGNPLTELPESVCDLSYLEFLDLHFCYILSNLPVNIAGLGRLRHLKIGFTTDKLQLMPDGFAKLFLLCTLDLFRAGGRYNDLSQLEDLSELEKIRISIHGAQKSIDPKWESKKMLRSLEIRFVGEGRDVGTIKLIDDFNPPPNLQTFKLEGYVGFQLPKWLEGKFVIKMLKRLTFRSASNILSLNGLRELSCLEFLWLCDIGSLKHIGRDFFGLPVAGQGEYEQGISAFCSLRTLRIDILENWETWEDLNEDDVKNIEKISVMAKLEDLTIDGCPNLKALPHNILRNIPSLNKIQVDSHLAADKPTTSRGKAIQVEPAQS